MPSAAVHAQSKDNTPPPGFVALFNGKDLTGWQALLELPGLKSGAGLDPAEPLKLSADERAAKQREADAKDLPHWTVRDGVLHYDGKGQNLQDRQGLRRLRVVRGLAHSRRRQTPASTSVARRRFRFWDRPGVGSGGLFNNKINPRNPIKVADRPVGEWNTFRILIKGDVNDLAQRRAGGGQGP